jgi:hypothetical protein
MSAQPARQTGSASSHWPREHRELTTLRIPWIGRLGIRLLPDCPVHGQYRTYDDRNPRTGAIVKVNTTD